MRVLIFAAVVFVLGIAMGGYQSSTEPPETVTRTVTETVEVPGPTVYAVSDECREYLDEVDATTQAVYDYERGVAPQQTLLRDAMRGLVLGDSQLVTQAITDQNRVNNDTTGPLQIIVANASTLPDLQTACQATLED